MHWQYLIPVLLIIFQIDLIIIPVLRQAGLSFWKIYFIAMPMGTAELFIQYYFFSWFRKEVVLTVLKRKAAQEGLVKEGIELVQQVRQQNYGVSTRIKNYCFKIYASSTDPDNKTVKKIKRGGHGIMLLLGLEPWVYGGRLFGVVNCSAIGWRNGLYSLALGNAVRMTGIVAAWDFILSFF
ncbi:MAG: hypothetical protein WD898_01825 [Candidatus Paceibacterota bacterium]